MKNTIIIFSLAALLLASCAGGNNQNQNNTVDSSVAVEQDSTKIVNQIAEQDVYSDTLFVEDVAFKVLNHKNLKGYDYEKTRTQAQYASLSGWNDNKGRNLEIECFKRKDGAAIAYVAIYEESEGDRTDIEKNWYLLKDNQLTKMDTPLITGQPLIWYSDEFGKLDFINNENFTDDNEKVWNELSNRSQSGEFQLSRQNANTMIVKAFDNNRGISPVQMDWNGEEFTKHTPHIKNYLHSESFGPIFCADKFPNLSNLSEYKTTEKDGKIQLFKKSELIAEITIKNNLVKDIDIMSPEYNFWQGWGAGMSVERIYQHFKKIGKDNEGYYYVPWFEEVRFYFNSADLLNADLQNPKFAPEAKITKVHIVGKEPKKATFALMPKTITIENYADPDTWDKTTSVYTFKYDDQKRITEVSKDNKPYLKITYTENQIDVVKHSDTDDIDEGETYNIDGSKISMKYYGGDGDNTFNFENGYIKSISNEVDDWCTFTWDGDLITSIDYNMENLTVSFEYERGDYYLDNQAIDLEYLIREGFIELNQSTFFTEQPTRCRSEKLPKKIIYDGSNVKAEISISYIFGSDGKIDRINCSDYKNNNRLFTRSIAIEY